MSKGSQVPNNSREKVYLVAGKRTPFGSFGGALKDLSPVDLATISSRSLLDSLNLNESKIEHVIFANVVSSSTDTMYAGRHVALRLGCPISTPAYNINRLCGSGMQVLIDAKRMIDLGEHSCILCTGAETLSMAPHLVYGSRFGTKYGSLKTVDMLLDALTDKHCNTPMGVTAENLSKDYSISRADCDEFSYQSHQKAIKAYSAGFIAPELSPVELKKGVLDRDQHLREDINLEQMSKLRPSFVKDGVVTPGSASGIVDGAASILVASESFVKTNKLDPLCELVDSSVIGVEPTRMGIGPVPSIQNLLKKQELTLDNIDLFEINEAFAAQVLAVVKELSLNKEKLNIWGGAIALGHPLGATGLKITLTLARAMKETGAKKAISSACIGGGQGISLLLESPS